MNSERGGVIGAAMVLRACSELRRGGLGRSSELVQQKKTMLV
jgi:hypothetical protein